MSIQQFQSELIVEQQETIAVLLKEIKDLRGHLRSKETAVSTSIASASKASKACGTVDILQEPVEAISEVNTQQKQEANGLLQTFSAQLLEKITHMQQTVDNLRAFNNELRTSNADLRAGNMELSRRIGNVEMSVEECQSSCADVRVLLNASSPLPTPTAISAADEEALSKMLLEAAKEGNAQRVRQLVSEGAHLEYRDKLNKTALHLAAQFGHVEALKTLIKLGARLEARNRNGHPPLHYAADWEQEECAELLLSAGASVHDRDKLGSTLLHRAALFGTPSIVKMLINAGADREAKTNSGYTPRDMAKDAAIRALL